MKSFFWIQAFAKLAIAFSSAQHPLKETESPSDFTIFQSHVSPDHSIRIKRQNSTLCDTPVNQCAGWLDIGHKHLFFWYFKSSGGTPALEVPEEEVLVADVQPACVSYRCIAERGILTLDANRVIRRYMALKDCKIRGGFEFPSKDAGPMRKQLLAWQMLGSKRSFSS